MADIIFAKGVVYKLPRPNAPDFVKGSLSFKVDEAIQFLEENAKNGWCNCNILVSKQGKPYVSLDTWKADPNYSSGKPNVNDSYQKKANNSLKNQGFSGVEEKDGIPTF